jgi:hypothetical protein
MLRYAIVGAAVFVALVCGLMLGGSPIIADTKFAIAVASALFAFLSLLIQLWVGSGQVKAAQTSATARSCVARCPL